MLAECRVFKSAAEIIAMKQAYKMAAEGHMEAMRACKPGIREDEVAAAFVKHCSVNYNQKLLAYPPIVCSGRRCSILHYFENKEIIPPEAMILTDMGMSLQHYASDITTSFPANGKFTTK